MKLFGKAFIGFSLFSLIVFQNAVNSGTADIATLTPASAIVLTGTLQPITFSTTNDKTFTIKAYHAEFSIPAGLHVADIVTTPAATTAKIDSQKNLLIFEWSAVGQGVALTANFNVSASAQGTYALSPSTVYYTDYNRKTYTASSNSSSISIRDELIPPSSPRNMRSSAGEGFINISWDRPADPDVAGYKIYRRTTATGYANIGFVNYYTYYTDASVEQGKAYYYKVTAVDYSGNESESSLETAETCLNFTVQTYNIPGITVAAVGDINGDKKPDIALGYPAFTVGKGGSAKANAGKVEIYYGGNTTGIPDVTLVGENAGDQFGYALAVVDMNKDGYDELIAGAPYYDAYVTSPFPTTAQDAGKVYIYSGGASLSTLPVYTYNGGAAVGCGGTCTYTSSEQVGFSIAPAGDVNHDGYQDVVVGAPNAVPAPTSGTTRYGKILVFLGGPSLSSLDPAALPGPGAPYSMGYAVASAGDVNGDGYDDIIAGNGSYGSSGAFLIYSNPLRVAFTLRTGISGDGFGKIVSSAGDINGDGYSDFAVNRYIYYGGPSVDKVSDRIVPDKADFISSIGDINKDGFADILVGPGPRVYFGGTIEENVPDISREGMTVLATADVDQDGVKEIIVAADVSKVYVQSLSPYLTLNPPGISITSPKNNLATDRSDIVITGKVAGNSANLRVGGSSVAVQPDGTFTHTVTLAEGTNYIEIIAETPDGKIGKRLLTIKGAQPTPLTVSITSPADGTVYNSQIYASITVSGTVSDAAAGIAVNGIPAYVYGTPTVNSFGAVEVPLAEGANTVTATATDDYGQTATHSITVTLLTKGMITGTVTDATTALPLSGVTVTVQDSQVTHTATTAAQGTYTVPGIAAGGFTVTFTKFGYFTQTSNGTSTNGQIQTINAQLTPWPPLTVTITSPQAGVTLNTSQVTVTGSVTNNAQVTVNGRQAAVTGGTFSVSVPLSEGQNTITAVAVDSYGQTTSDSISITVLTKGTITGTVTDTATGPPLASATVSVTDSLSTTITTFTDASGNYTMPYVTQGQFSGTITKEDYSTHSFSGTMIAGGTVTINGSITLQSPTLGIPAAVGMTLNSVTITWTTDQATDSLVEYGTTASYGNSAYDAVLTKNHSTALSSLAQGTAYHFRVTSVNSHNLSSTSLDSAFATAAPPTISGVQITNITTDSATLTWTTDQPCSSRVEYGTTATYGSVVENATLTLSHSATLTGLTERTGYHFRITSMNADGIAAQTGDKTLWTRSSTFAATTLGEYGNVTVMEVVGNYNANNTDGSINSLPRQEIAKEFFRNHQDSYDFLVVLSNFDFAMPDAQAAAFYMGVKNDTQGIGLTQFDSSDFFGSSGKLQGMIDMGNLTNLGASPGTLAFDETLGTLSHEFLHRWGAAVKFRAADGTNSSALLGRDNSHWSYLLDADGSVLYGNDWQANSDGTFTSVSVGNSYSPLDLYAMGLYDKSQVPSMTLIENGVIDPATLPAVGATISGTARTVTIDSIIAAEGERIPSTADSQKTFKIGYVLVTTPGTFTGSETAGIENVRSAWAGRFSSLTGGKGSIADVTPSISSSITSPTNNATIVGTDVTVTGAIINTTGNETGVMVNGIPATVYGSRFIAANVPLADGTNTIAVTATDTAGNAATTSVTVSAAPSESYITVTPNIESGISPLTVTFRIDGSMSFTSSRMTVSGPGSVEWLSTSVDEYSAKITGDGIYTFTAQVTAADGTVYEDTTTVIVLSRVEMDRLLKAKWEGMKNGLANGTIEEALKYLTTNSQTEYREIFELLAPQLPTLASGMNSITMIQFRGDIAEYYIKRFQRNTDISYFIYFVKDENGLWKIENF